MADHPLRPATDRRLGRPLPHQLPNRTQAAPKAHHCFVPQDICGISPSFPGLSPTSGHVPTRYSPVRRCRCRPRDLHVLSMPPAFTLSQDQTLRFIHHHQAQTQQQLRTALHSLSHRRIPDRPSTTRHQAKSHPRHQHPSRNTNTRAPTAHPTPRTSSPHNKPPAHHGRYHSHPSAQHPAIPQDSQEPNTSKTDSPVKEQHQIDPRQPQVRPPPQPIQRNPASSAGQRT